MLNLWKPEKIISGGQTGVDRAGLEAALVIIIPIGGYCPKGRRAEDGIIPNKYPLTELPDRNYKVRTERNIIESDGTLIINQGPLTGGTLLTARFAEKHRKPVLVVQLEKADPTEVHRWGLEHKIKVVNIAGPRESRFKGGIFDQAYMFLLTVLGTPSG